MALDTYPVLPAFTRGQANDVRTELLLGSLGWTDVSAFVLEIANQADSRGKPDESTSNTPGNLTLSLQNADGRFYDGNPLGPYFGNLGRNTQLRISVPEGASYLRVRDDNQSFASATAPAHTSDLDVRLDVTLDNWRAGQQIAGQWGLSPQFGWVLLLNQNGTLTFQYSTTGSNIVIATSAVPVPVPAGRRQLLRVTYNNVTGGVDFYYAAAQSLGSLNTRSAAWVHQYGLLTGTTGAIFASTAPTVIANAQNGSFGVPAMIGKFHAAELRNRTMPQRTGTNPPLLSAANGGTLTWAGNPGTAAGRKVLIAIWSTNAESITSVIDNGTTPTTYTLDKTITSGTRTVWIYRADNFTLPATGSYAVTITATGGAIVVAAGQAYVGTLAGAPFGSNTGSGTGGLVSSGNATPPANTALFFGAFADASTLAAEVITPTGVAFSAVTNGTQVNGSTSIAGACADRLDSGATGTAAATWSLGDSVAWAAAIVIYPGGNGNQLTSPDFTIQPAGTTSFNDTQALNWTISGTATITDRHYRFWGETSAFPTSWNSRGNAVIVNLQAAGILRRLTQSASTQQFQSAMRREVLMNFPDLVAYWPCEDGNNIANASSVATQAPTGFAPAGPAAQVGTYQGTPQFASASNFAASLALPTLNSSTWSFNLPSRPNADVGNILRFFMIVPPAGEPATFVGSATQDVPLVTLKTSGTGATYTLFLQGGAQGNANTPIVTNLFVQVLNSVGGTLGQGGSGIAQVAGIPCWVSMEMYQSGGNVQVAIGVEVIGQPIAYYNGFTFVGTLGNGLSVTVNSAATLANTGLGHFTYQRAFHDMSQGEYALPIQAWTGETAGNRFSRLCTEQGIPFQARGNIADTTLMGAQTTTDVMSLLQECVDADRGLWWEPPWKLALGYRTLADLLNQPPITSIPYASSEVAEGLSSNEDDQFTINDALVVNSYTGGQFESIVTSGALSNQAPPNGVGPYQAQPQCNLASDFQTADNAGWITWVGTAPDLRFPAIPFHMSRLGTTDFFALQEADIGDRLQIVTPAANGPAPPNTAQPSWLAPSSQTSYARGGIDVLVNNLATQLNVKRYDIAITGVPATPYLCAQADDLVHGHLGAANSAVEGYTPSADTSIAVSTPYDFLRNVATDPWTTVPSDFPFDVGIAGEQITVNSITGPAANPVTSDTANPPQIAITPGATGSLIYGAVVNPTNSTTFTADAATTFSQNVSDVTNAKGYGTFRSTATTTGGTPVTVGALAPAVAGLIAVAEFLSAGGITEDASSPATINTTGGKTVTTASFTPPAGALILAQVAANGSGAISMAVTNTGTLGAWTQLIGDGRNQATLWIARVTANPTAVTVTATASGANSANGIALTVKVLDNAAGRLGDQVMAVVRAQNGIVKNLTSGSPVDLYTTPTLSL